MFHKVVWPHRILYNTRKEIELYILKILRTLNIYMYIYI